MKRPWLIFTFLLCSFFLTGNLTAQSGLPWGVDYRFGAIQSYEAPDLANASNVAWDRLVIRWHLYQPDGPDNWYVPDSDRDWVATAVEQGREMTAILMATPGWATDGYHLIGLPRGLDLPIEDPNNTWAQFVRKIVQQYRGQIRHWIIWNEPDIDRHHPGVQFEGEVEDYYQLLKVAYWVAKQEDPNAVIHLAGLTYWHDSEAGRPQFLQRLVKLMQKDPTAPAHNFYFDVATAHIYFNSESVFNILIAFRQILSSAGLSHPIWLNETNAPPVDDIQSLWVGAQFPVRLDQQPAFIIQAHALAMTAGAQRIAVYRLYELGGQNSDGVHYGLFRGDRTPRPAVGAYNVVTHYFAHAQKVTALSKGNYHYIRMERPMGVTHVAWARVNQPAQVVIPATAGTVMALLFDQYGQSTPIAPINGKYSLNLPAAICIGAGGTCMIGGAPAILVELNVEIPLPNIAVPMPEYYVPYIGGDTGYVENINGSQTTITPASTLTNNATPLPTYTPNAVAVGTYTIQAGDNLYRVAVQHGTTVDALMKFNKLTSTIVYVGQVLFIPPGASVPPAQSTPSATVSATAVPTETSGLSTSGKTYTVVAGDTLYNIALRHQTTVAALRTANNIEGSLIYVGQVLKIPK